MIANSARRAAALLWALAFVLGTVGEGFGLHPCPHHDGGASPVASTGAASGGGHHVAAPDRADADAPSSHPGEGRAPGQSHDGPCTCGSACQAGTSAALPGVPHSAPTAAIVADMAAPRPAEAAVAIVRPPYFLPFAHAPPRLG